MELGHIAIWCDDIESMKDFYVRYFEGSSNEKYINPLKGYSSYFLSFGDGGCRIELMHRDDIGDTEGERGFSRGLAHISITVGSKDAVDMLVDRLESDGHAIVGRQRTTGDGYYEAVVLDPEGNRVEISDK